MIEGGTAFAALLGPALAGVLIPFLGAPNVLYVDAATFAISFLILLTLVPRKKPLCAPAQRGVLAGLRFVVRDGLLGPMTITIAGFGFIVRRSRRRCPSSRTTRSTAARASRALLHLARSARSSGRSSR